MGPLLGAKMDPNPSKIGPKGSQNGTLFKKVIFHEILRFLILFPLFWNPRWSPRGPRSHQEDSKRVPAMIFNRIYF